MPFFETSAKIYFILGHLLSLDAGPTPIVHRSNDTLPCPGWLH